MKKRQENLFAVVAPGLEMVCAAELDALGLPGVRAVPGGVEFLGGLREIYQANLRLRSASRILVRFGEMRCRDFPSLYRKALSLPWGRYLKEETRLNVRVVSHRSRLQHTGRIAETLQQAAGRVLGRAAEGPGAGEEQLLLVRMEDDCCRLSMDSSGALLHRRGYRQDIGAAPLRETLAAGILQLLGWRGNCPLVDPMCGSGTFPIEAALLAGNIPPGRQRSFSFMKWPRYRPGLWQALVEEAMRDSDPEAGPVIIGSDRDGFVVAAAERNAERAGVKGMLDFRITELGDLAPLEAAPGLVLCNPPYGARLGSEQDLRPLYRRLGQTCRTAFPGWQLALVCPDRLLAEAINLPYRSLAVLRNGGLQVELLVVALE